MISDAEQTNYETFRDCISNAVISKLSIEPKKERRRAKTQKSKDADTVKTEQPSSFDGNDAEELGDFVDVLIQMSIPGIDTV